MSKFSREQLNQDRTGHDIFEKPNVVFPVNDRFLTTTLLQLEAVRVQSERDMIAKKMRTDRRARDEDNKQEE